MKAAATTMPMNRQQRRRARREAAKGGTAVPSSSLSEMKAKAAALIVAGDLAGAERGFRAVLARAPKDVEALLAMGEIAKRCGVAGKAYAYFKAAVEADQTHATAWSKLGGHLHDIGRPDGAVVALARAVALEPDDPGRRLRLGICQYSAGQLEAARETLRIAVVLGPDNAFAHFELGKVFQSNGDFDEAMEHYRTALECDPMLIDVHYRIGEMNRQVGETEEVLATLSKVADSPDETDMRRAMAHYTAGRLHHRAGNHDAAFDEFARGNALCAKSNPYRGKLFHSVVDENIAAFTADTLAAVDGRGHESELPVFVVGMPRSGTTLVEKVIAAHGSAAGAGELDTIGLLDANLRQVSDGKLEYPRDAGEIESDQLRALAEQYLGVLGADAGDGIARVVDKMPSNFFHVGLMATLFPNARFIHCRRHPLDVALSCFTQFFSDHFSMAFSNDLDAFADYYALHDKIMAHWKEILPDRILDVHYEDMTAAQEDTSRRLIAHIGLEWDDACLEFHKQEGTVQTASVWQVRQPIYRTSVAKWRKYEKHLAPLKAKLEDLGVSVPD